MFCERIKHLREGGERNKVNTEKSWLEKHGLTFALCDGWNVFEATRRVFQTSPWAANDTANNIRRAPRAGQSRED